MRRPFCNCLAEQLNLTTSFNFSVINGANYSVGWLVLRNIDYEMGYGTCFFVSESKFLRLKEYVS